MARLDRLQNVAILLVTVRASSVCHKRLNSSFLSDSRELVQTSSPRLVKPTPGENSRQPYPTERRKLTELLAQSDRVLLDSRTADGELTLATFSVLEYDGRTRRRAKKFQWVETETENEVSPIFATDHEAQAFKDGYDEPRANKFHGEQRVND